LRLNGTTLVGDGGEGGATFTQADIYNGLVTYEHNGSETTSDSFNFSVADGAGGSIANTSFSITVNPVDDQPPVLATNAGLTVNEGAVFRLTPSQLQVTDADTPAGERVYTLDTAVTQGTLKLSDTTLSAGQTFIQDDIDNNLVTYEHDGSETTSDSFNFSVADGAGGSIANTSFSIGVTPVNDAPVNTVAGTQTIFEDTSLIFSAANNNQISINDVDAGNNPVQVTLSVDNGTLNLSGTTGLTFNQGDSAVAITTQPSVALSAASIQRLMV
jgi:VCBS repeat-containing protein